MTTDTGRLECSLNTPSEAMIVAVRAAGVCADSTRVAFGLAELLVNAVEHGNLAIGHTLKSELLKAPAAFEAEVERRLVCIEFARRTVRLIRRRTAHAWCFEIEDDGDGFDWRKWLADDVAARRSLPCGRGILLAAQLCGAPLEYLGPGNRVRIWVPAQAHALCGSRQVLNAFDQASGLKSVFSFAPPQLSPKQADPMNDRSQPADRRLDRRIPLGSDAAILLAHGDRIAAECMELSVSGMTLRAPYVPGESEIITVEVAPPANGIERPPLRVRLAVLRCHPLDDGRYEIGGTTIEIIG